MPGERELTQVCSAYTEQKHVWVCLGTLGVVRKQKGKSVILINGRTNVSTNVRTSKITP